MGSVSQIAQPTFRLVMNGRDVTVDLRKYLTSISFTDHVEGEADTLEVMLEDKDSKFRGPWYPREGDSVTAQLGYDGKPLMACGDFEIDELELSGPPDTVSIRAIAAGVMRAQRTHQGRAYEDKTLRDIVFEVARRLHLEVVGDPPALAIRRVTQIHENDLTFLHRLADAYGYAFSVKGSKLVWLARKAIRTAGPRLTLKRTELERYRLRDKIMGVVKKTTVAYHDPKTKRLRKYKVTDTSRKTTSVDELNLNVRAESQEQAQAKAEAAQGESSIESTVLEFSLPGRTILRSGINFTLADMGVLNGHYHIVMSRHVITRDGGYVTECEAKRVWSVK